MKVRIKRTGQIVEATKGTECSPEWYSCSIPGFMTRVAMAPYDVEVVEE